MWGVRGRALSHPRLPALWAGCRGSLPTGCGFGGVRAWGPVTNPTARALACWLCALWGRHEGARGGASCLGVGRRGSGAHPTRLPALWAGCRGPLPTGCWCEGVRAWGPVTNPTARALTSWLCALWGRHEGARGGRLLPGCGASGVGRSPTPTARPLGGLPGPATHWLWVRGGAGVGTRHQPHSARSCVLWGRHEGARGGHLLPGCGASGVGRSPTPDCPPSGRAAGAHYPLAVGAGGCGRGDPSPTPQRALLRAGFARSGGGMRAPRGGASCLGVGRPGWGALPPPTARPLGGLPGPTTHWLWVRGGAGVGTRHQPHSARSCVLWGRYEGARRGRLLPGCGASGVRRSPTPDCPPSGRAAGAHYPLAVGAGGCGRGDPSPTPQRALLQAGFARCGGGMRVPGGGASCLGLGRPGSSALPPPTARPLGGLPGPTTHYLWVRGGAGVGARLSLAPCPVPRFVVCCPHFPGFAAPGGRCGLAPVLMPWLWPAACLSGVPRGPALVRRSSTGPVALGAPVGFPVTVVPTPTPGAVAPGFTGWLRGARGGRPRTGLIVPASGPCRGKDAGRAPRRTHSGPRDGFVPGGSLRLWSWAACAAVVWRVWTRSLMRPVSRTVRLATGDSAGAPGLFRADGRVHSGYIYIIPSCTCTERSA